MPHDASTPLYRFSRVLALVFCTTLTILGAVAHAHSVAKGDLLIYHPYAPPSLKGVTSAGVYIRSIKNQGDKPDRLVSASSPVAARVGLHSVTLDGTVMRMREVSAIDLPANATVSLRQGNGAYHLMLVDLKQPLKIGDRFDLTLQFERAGTQTVQVWVQAPHATESEDHQH
jgi:copper(I)-binding protein